jgi:DNA polymerase III delta prime subunit
MPMDDRPMFVILDELDSASATSDSSFQKALRNVIEAGPNIVYVCTANYGTKIIPAVLSRCPQISLKFEPKDVLLRLKDILDYEKIQYTTDDLKEFVRITVKKFYPDIRSIVNYLQGSCSSGKLVVNANAMVDAERTNFIKDLVSKCVTEKNILNVRKFYIANKDKIDDYKTFASDIFNYVIDNGVVSDKTTILKLANVFYQLNTVIDPEIQFFAMLTLISQASQTN